MGTAATSGVTALPGRTGAKPVPEAFGVGMRAHPVSPRSRHVRALFGSASTNPF